ncbi:claudin-20 [Erinaceus europaeus]|uniref:Claudin n=1 Tax=Erinaceus europaeus TaxID=9365 RepID=A0A1S2ZA51_ERIEU|nr:claudin-20 [Erinaceus europaeus]
MASGRLQLLAFALALSGVSGVLAATLLPNWTVSVDAGPSILSAVAQLQGLWVDCTWHSTGLFSCAVKRPLLALPSHVQAARAAMVLACVLSALGLCACAVGMRCTRLGGDPATKGRAALTAGVCLAAAGLCTLIPTVWYTKEIVANFLDLSVPDSRKQEPGGAMYLGFISATLLCISGVIFCTSCARRGPEAWLQAPRPKPVSPLQLEGGSAYNLKDYV